MMQKFLAILWWFVLPLAVWGGVFAAFADGAKVAQWQLQDNAASTTVIATVGTNGTLTNAGNTSASSSTPGPGTALTRFLTFDGTDDYVACTTGNAAALKNKSFATLCGWIKLSTADTTAAAHRVVYLSTNLGAGSTRAGIHVNATGQIIAQARAGDGESLQTKTSTNSYDDNSWHHVAAVYDYAGDSITIYVDGTSVAQTGTISFTATATSNADSIAVNLATDVGNYYKGAIADCRVYDSDESANFATIIAEKDSSSTIVPLLQRMQLNMSLVRPTQWDRFVSLTPIMLEK